MIGIVGADATTLVERGSDAIGVRVEAAATAADLSADPEAVVATDEAALLDAVRSGVTAPVLAVAVDGLPSVPEAAVESAVGRLAAGEWETRGQPLLTVTDGDRTERALFDAMLVTAEPARISEYAVESVDGSGSPFLVNQFRADGVVVATAAGSHGYAASTDGPLLAPGIDAAAVAPVAPFTVDRDRWVLPYPVTVTVERDETDVALLVDDRTVGRVDPDEPVTVERDGSVDLVVLSESRSPFAGGLEKT